MSLNDVLDKEITVEEMEDPKSELIVAFKNDSVWRWIENNLILEQRQIIAELTQGKRFPDGETLSPQDMNQRQGAYQQIDKIFNMLEVAKESNNKNKEE